MTWSVTGSIEIDAPVEEVFAFVSDPKKLLEEAFPLNCRFTVSDVATTPEGGGHGIHVEDSVRAAALRRPRLVHATGACAE